MYESMLNIVRCLTLGRKRFILPVLAVATAHAVLGLVLYYSLRAGMTFSTPFMGAHAFNWVYLFSAWDSNYYLEIARNWYPAKLDPLWAFPPLYPAVVRTLGLLGVSLRFAGFAVALVCGLASTVLFQQISEQYMGRTQALIASSLYFLFPPVFVFSFVSYPDPMFLLFALTSWYFHRKHSDLNASVAAGLCAITRLEGILLVIPLLYDYIFHRQFRKIGYLIVPLSAITGWELYGYGKTGTWLPSLAAGVYWYTPKARAVILAIHQLMAGNLSSIEVLLPYWWLIIAVLAILAIVVFVGWRDWKIDRALSIYVFTSLIILGSRVSVLYRSFPRILSFMFPIGLSLHTRKLNLLVVTVLIFLVLDYVAWLAFLTDGFY